MDDSALTELTMLSEPRLPTLPAAGPRSSASTLGDQPHNETSDTQLASDPEPSAPVTPTFNARAESCKEQSRKLHGQMGVWGTDPTDVPEEPMEQAGPTEDNDEQAASVQKHASMASGGYKGKQKEVESEEEDLYTDFPPEEEEPTQDEKTKHTSIPNPFMPPPSQQVRPSTQDRRLPFTVQSIPAELPAVPEEPRRRSLSLNEAGRSTTVVTPDLGLGLTVDPPPDDISALGGAQGPTESETPSVARKRPPIKPRPSTSSQPTAAKSQPTKSRAVSTSKSPAVTHSTLPSSFTATYPKATTATELSGAEQVTTSMLGAFAQSGQGSSRI
ncbi:hypothetical protein V565_273000, partial [Rhizoctonia solani 123E]